MSQPVEGVQLQVQAGAHALRYVGSKEHFANPLAPPL
jgi:hypothetical protein